MIDANDVGTPEAVVDAVYRILSGRAGDTPLLAAGDFYERDIERRVEIAGNVAQIWSRYAAGRAPDGPPFIHGTGSFQLVTFDDRWWIASAIWQVDLARCQ